MTTPDELKTATTDPVRAALAAMREALRTAYNYCGRTSMPREAFQQIEAALRTPAPLHSGELAKRADAAIKSLRGSDHKALVTSYSVAQSLAEVIEGLLLHSGEPVARECPDCGSTSDVHSIACRMPNATKFGRTSPPAIELDGGGPEDGAEIVFLDGDGNQHRIVYDISEDRHPLGSGWFLHDDNSLAIELDGGVEAAQFIENVAAAYADFGDDVIYSGKNVSNILATQATRIRALAVPKPERAVAREDDLVTQHDVDLAAAVRRTALEECAKIARQTSLRCVREKTPGDAAADFIHRAILALSPVAVALHDGGE